MSLDSTITKILKEFHLIPDSRKKELKLLRDFILKKKGKQILFLSVPTTQEEVIWHKFGLKLLLIIIIKKASAVTQEGQNQRLFTLQPLKH